VTPRFPDTRVSVLEALAAADPDRRRDAADLLARAYRAPVYDGFARRWGLDRADADDLTQEFFATALSKGWLGRFDPAKGRFRTFLRLCADRFAANRYQAARRQKRGGGGADLRLDDVEPVADGNDQAWEDRFRAEWARSVFDLALTALREEGVARDRATHVAIFEAYDVADPPETDRPTYASLAAGHGLTDSQVLNHLAWARRRFRSHALGVLRRLAGSEAEYRDDVRELLGIEAP
jgi:RNA polymerase sigma-70 factor (ECF subfamily)